MARFDIYILNKTLVIDCQADILDHLERRFVVPLLPPETIPAPISRLHPQFDVAGRKYIMATHMSASVPVRSLGRKVHSLHDQQDAIATALDMLIIGF